MKIHGIFPPLTTPFKNDGALDLTALANNVERYNRVALAGYVATGSTGEAIHLSEEETDKVWATVREYAAPGKILIAGTGEDTTAGTIAKTNRAADLGYQVALVKTPYYYKPQMTTIAMEEHFLRVADAVRIPLLIYSVPQFTGVAVEAATVERLARHGNIMGIKESSGNVQRVTEIIHACPPAFQTLVGSGTTIYSSLNVGAVGGILGIACVLPELCVELYQTAGNAAAGTAGSASRAAALQHILLNPTITIVAKYGVPGTKYAMDQMGYKGGHSRRPFLALDEAGRRAVEAVLSGVGSVAARG